MQKLILISGEAWTGKTTCTELLYQQFSNSAWLDGDNVWKVNPFSVFDKRLRNSNLNMAFVIDNYLKNNFEYVFFSSIVLCNKEIREKILSLLSLTDYKLIFFILFASKSELKSRARKRDSNLNPQFMLLAESLKQDAIFIDTTNKETVAIVDEMVKIIKNHE